MGGTPGSSPAVTSGAFASQSCGFQGLSGSLASSRATGQAAFPSGAPAVGPRHDLSLLDVGVSAGSTAEQGELSKATHLQRGKHQALPRHTSSRDLTRLAGTGIDVEGMGLPEKCHLAPSSFLPNALLPLPPRACCKEASSAFAFFFFSWILPKREVRQGANRRRIPKRRGRSEGKASEPTAKPERSGAPSRSHATKHSGPTQPRAGKCSSQEPDEYFS